MRRGWWSALLGAALGASVSLFAAVETAGPWRASVTTSIGRQLDPDFPADSVSFEPSLAWSPDSSTALRLRALLDHRVDAVRPWSVPYAELLGVFIFRSNSQRDWGVFSHTNAADLHSLSTEGWQLRQTVGGFLRWRLGPVTAEFSAGPFLSGSEYARRRDGSAFSQTGLLEQLSLSYQWGRVKLEVLGLAVQDWNGRWRGFYSTFERVTVRLAPRFSVGVTHQLVRSQIDEVSGEQMPIGLFDGRRSRLAGFIQWQI